MVRAGLGGVSEPLRFAAAPGGSGSGSPQSLRLVDLRGFGGLGLPALAWEWGTICQGLGHPPRLGVLSLLQWTTAGSLVVSTLVVATLICQDSRLQQREVLQWLPASAMMKALQEMCVLSVLSL